MGKLRHVPSHKRERARASRLRRGLQLRPRRRDMHGEVGGVGRGACAMAARAMATHQHRHMDPCSTKGQRSSNASIWGSRRPSIHTHTQAQRTRKTEGTITHTHTSKRRHSHTFSLRSPRAHRPGA